MIIAKDVFENMLNSPIRTLRGRVEIYQDSTPVLICGCHDRLIDFKIERIGEQSKMFGYGICQKLTTNLLDRDRELNITKANSLEVEFGVDSDYLYPCPKFYVEDVKRDENNNNLTITAYDALFAAAAHKVSELNLEASYTIGQFAAACAALLHIPLKIEADNESFNTFYPTGANFEGTETIREALNAVAEATQTIYYIDSNWELTFKKLDITGEPVATIDKTKYYTLKSEDIVKITSIVHATELGDNLQASIGEDGVTQYVRDNPFWELREDVADLVENAVSAVAGLKINPFELDWRGNYLLEIGDKIAITTKDDKLIVSYLLDDVIDFNGALSGKSRWFYNQDKNETATNPTTLGQALKQTYARVDKANKQISLVASENNANKDTIAALQINTESINASVTRLEENVNNSIDSVNEEITNIKSSVETKVTAEDLTIKIQEELSTGVEEVTISGKDFTFDSRGLTIEDINPDTNNVIKTTVSNNGMIVNANNKDVLIVNDIGVQARNLHANTYLMIGTNSRFEDYGYNRTGCFWIGR